ncbi:MAG: hypothetical protein A2068_13395 [Ignavibacteria bacterium GWB2_35_6b]|nr:MAG: hypothetical protein A2068_13395 [Ignavibacteria bacterium GWB2_35_6b]
MLFNKKTEYSIKILLFLAERKDNAFINAGEIAASVKLPKEFLSKILQTLTHFGIVDSQKGKGGGFRLGISSDKIKLIELINAFEDEAFFKTCIIGMYKECRGCNCPMHDNWESLKEEMKNSLLIDIRKNKNFLQLNQTNNS